MGPLHAHGRFPIASGCGASGMSQLTGNFKFTGDDNPNLILSGLELSSKSTRTLCFFNSHIHSASLEKYQHTCIFRTSAGAPYKRSP